MSAILSESYSFIWQPKVRMKSFFFAVAVELGSGRRSGDVRSGGNDDLAWCRARKRIRRCGRKRVF